MNNIFFGASANFDLFCNSPKKILSPQALRKPKTRIIGMIKY